jgi:hypothetical protein
MRHATTQTLERLEWLLDQLRKKADLTEKKPGIFYRKALAFLHFHEDEDGLFADVKVGTKFQRHRVSIRAEQSVVLKIVEEQLNS